MIVSARSPSMATIVSGVAPNHRPSDEKPFELSLQLEPVVRARLDGKQANHKGAVMRIAFAILVVFLASFAYATEKPSQMFLKKAIEGNFAEIEMGKLAQQNGQNSNVKNFGQMLSNDHTTANQKAMDAAKSMGMTPPDGPNAKQRADYDKMSKMSGAQFDRDFAKHMVADHQKDIAEYKKEAKQSDAAGEYAKAQIDVLQRHLETAKSLRAAKTSRR
jgi:putative membrane protein